MKRLICLILCLFFLVPYAAAAETPLGSLMEQYGLDETNFAFRYLNLTTGGSFGFNEEAFFPAGRVWTLPLHMYYYEQEALGAFAPPEEAPDQVYTIGELTLEDCRYQSLLQGDEEVAQKMRSNLGTMEQYQSLINERFGHYAESSLPEEYFTGFRYSAVFLMNCLRELEQRETFTALLQNLRLVQTGDGLAAYGCPYDLIHLRGEAEGMLCDVGRIAAPQPYLLVCFVSEKAGGDAVLAEVNALLCAYAMENAETSEPTDATSPSRNRDDAAFQINGTKQNRPTELLLWIGIALAACAVLALVIGVIVKKLRKKRNR